MAWVGSYWKVIYLHTGKYTAREARCATVSRLL
jgi:hypothetical protein